MISKQNLHQYSTGKGRFILGDGNRAERPKQTEINSAEKMKRRVLRTWGGEGGGQRPSVLLIGLTRRTSIPSRSSVTGGGFSGWSKGPTKVRWVPALPWRLGDGVLFPLMFALPHPQFLKKDSPKGPEALKKIGILKEESKNL